MQILSAQEVKDQENRKKNAEEQRVKDLLTEEARLVRSVNGLRTDSDDLTREMGDLQVKKDTLLNEVTILEAQKAAALQPIMNVRDEADKRITLAVQKEAEATERALSLEIEATRLRALKSSLDDRDDQILAKEEDIKTRDASLVEREGRFGAKEQALGEAARLVSVDKENLQQDMERREGLLETKKTELLSKENDLNIRSARIEFVEDELLQKKRAFEEDSKRRLAKLNLDESTMLARSQAIENEWMEFRSRVQKEDESLKRREASVKTREAALYPKEAALSEKETNLRAYEQSLISKELELNPRSKLNKSH